MCMAIMITYPATKLRDCWSFTAPTSNFQQYKFNAFNEILDIGSKASPAWMVRVETNNNTRAHPGQMYRYMFSSDSELQ